MERSAVGNYFTRREREAVFYLERILPHRARHLLRSLFFFLTVLALAYVLVSPLDLIPSSFALSSATALGILSLLLSIFLALYLAEAFFRSVYLSSSADAFEAARIVYAARSANKNLRAAFLSTPFGKRVLARAGVGRDALAKLPPSYEKAEEMSRQLSGLEEVGRSLLAGDRGFANALVAHGIQESDFLHILKWVLREEEYERYRERWWAPERLAEYAGLGKTLAYGEPWALERYGTDLSRNASLFEWSFLAREEEVKSLVSILSRTREANALLVGPAGVGKMSLVKQFARRVYRGDVPPHIAGKRIVILNANVVVSSAGEKGRFEKTLLTIFAQAEDAGNIILVLEDFPAFIRSARALGSDAVSLMDKFLDSPDLQVIAVSDDASFQQELFRNTELMNRFERVDVREPDTPGVLAVLEGEVRAREARRKIFVTFGAVKAIAEGAERYIAEGVMPDKAIDLLDEVIAAAFAEGRYRVGENQVSALLGLRTGIPMGEASPKEKEKLIGLEAFLHKRVVGQDAAVSAVSDAMRRARAGIGTKSRPLGVFLFLGPTGVGKTETAKALSEAFFGSEGRLLRLDMSEYSDEDALARLIGSFEGGKEGTLAVLLRTNPSGVLLLDEFEKTTPRVHDLFLQVFDEGFFSDMEGKRVSARNVIIIATSNAASDFIFRAVGSGATASGLSEKVVKKVIEDRVFKPELLNRFDAVVVFHPLGKEHLEKIARLLLEDLERRLKDKGVGIAIDEELIRYITSFGADPTFGARPMRRAIQDKLEKAIADALLGGSLRPGGRFTFRPELVA